MQKFYYKKGEPLDSTPTILRLERRHTIDAKLSNEDRPISERSSSISSLGRPTIPRVRSREVAKSFSGESLIKAKRTGAKKVITEEELSSSWLYKSMQASVNSRFKSPNKSPYRPIDDLAPVKLEDPKMKPIPVKRSRTPSCLCRAATMVAVGLCTVGFLVAVTGLIYMEVFANKNLTSHESPETVATEYELDFPEGYDQLSSVKLNLGKGRKKVQNPLNKDNSDNVNKDFVKETSLSEADARNIDVKKTDNVELSQYLDGADAKIKFRDSETVIYEVKSSDSTKFQNSILDGLRGRSFLSFNATEKNVLNGKNGSEILIENEQFKSAVAAMDLDHDTKKKQPGVESAINSQKEMNTGVNSDSINDDSVKIELNEFEHHEISMKPHELSVSVIEAVEDTGSPIKPDDSQSIEVKKEIELHSKADNAFGNKLIVESEKQVTSSSFVEYADEDSSEINNDHNIDSMVEVIDDTEDANLDYAIRNRNGDSFLVESLSSTEVNMDSFHASNIRPADLEIIQPALPKKPVDLKVSFAEAMKHLQVLDVNNKILSSRTKIGKRKDNTKKRKQNNASWKKDSNLERMKYLQKVRQVLYESFQ